MDEAIGRKDDRTAKLVRLAVEIADLAAGFLDQENAGGGVPLVKAELPKSFKAAGGYAGEIQRGGAIAANTVGAQSEVPIVMNVGAGNALVHRETGAEQTGAKLGNLGDVNGLAVERGALAASGSEQFIVKGIEDH